MKLINLEPVLLGATIAFMGWQYHGNINWVLFGGVVAIIGVMFGPRGGSANYPFLLEAVQRKFDRRPEIRRGYPASI